MTRIWDQLYKDGFSMGRDADPFVVRHEPLLRARGVRRVLDHGCGRGRHLAYLLSRGFEAVGFDASPTGVGEAAVFGHALRADMHALPFADASFDAAVSVHVIYHSDRTGMQRSVDEVARVLRSDGLFLGTFISTRTWKYGAGPRIEPHTFLQPEGLESGVPHHYCDEDELRLLLDGFEVEFATLDEFPRASGEPGVHSHWMVVARR